MALKEVLAKFGDLKIIPIVVFTPRAELKIDSNTDVVYSLKLLRTIKKYKEECISDDLKKLIFLWLKGLNVYSKENITKHVKSVDEKKKRKLEKTSK